MPAPTAEPELTQDDLELLAMLARGMSGARLSQELGVNPRTVQRKIDRLRAYFGVPTTMQVVVAAVRRGLA